MNIIVIDCGASFFKTAVFEDGMLLDSEVLETPIDNAADCKKLTTLLNMIRMSIAKFADGKKEVVLAICNEMHGFVLADKNMENCSGYISWQREFDDLSMSILSSCEFRDDIEHTGMPLKKGLPSTNLSYVLKKMQKNFCNNWYFYTLGDYIIKALSGLDPVCHETNAAATGLYDIKNHTWNRKLINAVAADKVIFPSVGMSCVEFVLNGTRIIALPAIGDQQAALLGAGLENNTDISFNLGTGAQVSRLVAEPCFSKSYQIRPYIAGKYIKSIPHLPSGRAVNVYFRFVREIAEKFGKVSDNEKIWQWIMEQMDSCSDANLQCDLSFFANPISSRTSGSISNIGEYGFTVGNLFSSVMLQMSKNYLWAAKIISSDMPDVKRVIFSGGIARHMNLIRNVVMSDFATEVEVVIGNNETLYGLMKYAMLHKEDLFNYEKG